MIIAINIRISDDATQKARVLYDVLRDITIEDCDALAAMEIDDELVYDRDNKIIAFRPE